MSCSKVGDPLEERRAVLGTVGGAVGRCPIIGGGVAPLEMSSVEGGGDEITPVVEVASGELGFALIADVGIATVGFAETDGAPGVVRVCVAAFILLTGATSPVNGCEAASSGGRGALITSVIALLECRRGGGGAGGTRGAGGGVMDGRCVSGVISWCGKEL